ncbi:MAG: hypothetical protein ACOYK6_01590 [Chthoniobacterales bacterium]
MGRLLRELYNKRCDLWAEAYSTYKWEQKYSKRIFPPPEKLLKIDNGIIGLSNPTGNCAFNSSLQLVKTALQAIPRNTLEWKRVSKKLEETIPYLLKFLNNELATEGDCKELHKEVARVLSEDFWYRFFSYSGIAKEQLEKGHFYGGRAMYITPVLLHHVGISPLCY